MIGILWLHAFAPGTDPGPVARLRRFTLNLLRAKGIRNVRQALSINAFCLDHLLAYRVT